MDIAQVKLMWSLTSHGLQNQGVPNVVDFAVRQGLEALSIVYHPTDLELIQSLQQQLEKRSALVLSLMGRRALLRVPSSAAGQGASQKSQMVNDGQALTFSIYESPNVCASNNFDIFPENTGFEIYVSSFDQIIDLKVGSLINVAYGEVCLRVVGVDNLEKVCSIDVVVEEGGVLTSGDEVHSPDMSRKLLPLLPADSEALAGADFKGLADYVMLPGIVREKDLLEIRAKILGQSSTGSERHPSVAIQPGVLQQNTQLPPRILLCLDSQESVEGLDKLLKHVDGVLFNRSELGLDIHPHELPIVQKHIIERCKAKSKLVILASELVHSMVRNANPTRAEVLDIANAVQDGVDALILAREVTEGPNATLVAEVCRETLSNSESWLKEAPVSFRVEGLNSVDDAVAYGAILLAEQAQARALVCVTEGGYTAMRLSSMLSSAPILALTYNREMACQLALFRSVHPALLSPSTQVENLLTQARDFLVNSFGLRKGDRFVFVSLTASSISTRNSNLFSLQEID